MKIETVKKLLYYYELNFDFNEDFETTDGDQFRELFRIIFQLARTKAKIRYQKIGEKAIFIQDVKIHPSEKTITGKLRCIRMDILPEIMNIDTDEARGIDAKEEEGLVETTHFLIDHSRKKKKLVFEHNQFGAKITDFIFYLDVIGKYKKATKEISYTLVVKDELAKIQNRINRCSEFVVKIHKDNIDKIKTMDKGVHSALKASIEQFKTDYTTIKLKFDYQKRTETKDMNKSIFNLIRNLIKDKSKVELFNTLSIRAEDTEKNNRLEAFDLLMDRVKSEIKVEKKARHRTIISEDMFDKMQKELLRKKI